jgi:hypothetical protein
MEIAVADGYKTVEDVDAMIEMIRARLARVRGGQRIVIAADWRPCTVFTPAVAERAVTMLTGVVPRVERSAILHRADHATSVLQVFRLVKESHFEARRVFTAPTEMEKWLGEMLGPEERGRLHAFLGQRA